MLHTSQSTMQKGREKLPIFSEYIHLHPSPFVLPLVIKIIQANADRGSVSDTNEQANRNKKSLGLSFQHKQGVDILHKLVAKCDILVENYLPGTLKKYALDYDTLRSINPGLIYASITGYGQTGPYSNRAGYDVMVEAEFGLMHITGQRDGPPVKVGVAVTDLTTGLYTSNSIMAALLGRAKNGKGQHLDVALSDCQTATLANIASSCLISGEKDSGRWGTAHRMH